MPIFSADGVSKYTLFLFNKGLKITPFSLYLEASLELWFVRLSPPPIPIISSSLIGRVVKKLMMRLVLTICPKSLFPGSSHVHAPRHTPQGRCPSVTSYLGTTEWTGLTAFLYRDLFMLEVRCKLNSYFDEFNSVLLDFHSEKVLFFFFCLKIELAAFSMI